MIATVNRLIRRAATFAVISFALMSHGEAESPS